MHSRTVMLTVQASTATAMGRCRSMCRGKARDPRTSHPAVLYARRVEIVRASELQIARAVRYEIQKPTADSLL